MPVFEYTELSTDGRKGRGTIDAASLEDARRKLRTAGLHILEITDGRIDIRQQLAIASRSISFGKIKSRDLSAATRQLASLLHAGVPLVPALSALVEQLSTQPLGKVFAQLRDRVSEGMPLAEALAEFPTVFSEIYISMVRAGEATGTLQNVLSRLAEMIQQRVNLINKVRGAMAYPLFMAIVGTAVVIFIFTFVIPSLTKLFLQMNRRLPGPTVMLMKISSFMEHYFWLFAALLGLFVAGIVFWLKTTQGRAIWDRVKLKCPLLGDLARKIAIARFSRTLAVLLTSGLSIVEALELGKRVIGNTMMSEAVDNAKDAISRGDSIANAFRRSGIFPPVVIHMIAAGEQSGGIEEGLGNVADSFDSEVETTVKALTSLLEPIMIVLLGIIVGFIVLAILLPIFDINQAIV
jgi:general secretion pathway protein F